MASTARIDELKKKFDENPRRYFAPLANEFRKAGEVEQAIMICEEFLPQQPGHMSGHIVYGQALFEAGRFDQSRTVFETALTLDPENLIALRHLGDIAKGQGDVDAARRWYDRVLEADPRNDEIQALIAGLQDVPASAAPAISPPAVAEAPADAESAATVEMTTVSREERRFAPPPAEAAETPAVPVPPAAPPPLPEPIELDFAGDVSLQMPETVPVQPGLPDASTVHARAEGLESTEFAPPSGPVDRAHDLGSSLEAGEFTAPSAPVAPLDGLEETSFGGFERSVPDGGPPLPMLDTSESTEPPRRADPPPMPDLEPAPAAVADVRREQPADVRPEPSAEMPPELPPAVIAAEAELLDLDDSLTMPATVGVAATPPATPSASPNVELAPEPEAEREPEPERASPAAPAAPFVTETMAELFLKQGFREQALDIYRQLLAANPHDERLQHRVLELRPPAPAPAGESVRDFLARFAARQPSVQAASAAQAASATPPSNDDFASFDAVPEPLATHGAPPAPAAEPEAYPEPVAEAAPAPAAAPRQTPSSAMSTGVERGAASQGSGGSIDALFGNRAVGSSEDSAASALAQAFGAGSEPAPAISGRPARAAAGELSLDSVFRDAPPRPPRAAQNFSFDQFFSAENAAADQAAAPPAPAPDPTVASQPAERSADDIEQFNSWLQGLKPK